MRICAALERIGTRLRQASIGVTQELRSEQSLESARGYLDALINAMPTPVLVKDHRHRYAAANAAFCQFFGRPVSQIIGRTDFDFFSAVDAAYFQATDAQVLEHGIPVEYEHAYTPGSRTHWMLVRKTRLITPKGDRLSVLVMQDMTSRRAAEEALRRSEARFRRLTALSADWYWEQDEQFRFSFMSADTGSKTGIANDTSIGLTRWDHPGVDPSSADWAAHKETCAAHREFRDFVYRRVAEDGSIRWVCVSGEPIFDEAGRFTGYHGVGRDLTEAKRSEAALTLERNLLRTLVDHLPFHIYVKDAEGRYLLNNTRNLKMLGRTNEADAIGKTPYDFFPPAIARMYVDDDRNVLSEGTAIFHREEPYVDASGTRGWYSTTKVPLRDVDGRITGLVGMSQDTTEIKRVQDNLRRSQSFLEHAMAVGEIGTWSSELAGSGGLKWSTQTCRIFGIHPDAFDGRVASFYAMVHPEDRDTIAAAVLEAMEGSAVYEVDHRIVRPDGTLRWVHEHAEVMRDAHGKPVSLVGVVQDITARKEAEQRLLQLAHYDNLTGLPNRTLFFDRLQQSLARSRRDRRAVAVVFLDLDNFKLVNDTLGHAAGDQLLKQVAERLLQRIRTVDTVGRLGGDEFGLVLSDLSHAEDADNVTQKLMHALELPFELDGHEMFVTASMGVTLFPADSEDPDTLLKNADAAMYRAKDLGRTNYQFYKPEMNARSVERLSLETQLRRALDRGEFELFYQPKADLQSRRINGAEALLRWNHPQLGLMLPERFVSILEDNGLIVNVGNWVLEQACRQMRRWNDRGLGLGLRVAVNLSARQLQSPHLGRHIAAIIAAVAIDPSLLELEITETVLMRNPEYASRILGDLRHTGIRLSVDDFGTGYSSLSYLKSFPLDALKIDRSFVRDLPHDDDSAAIARAIIAMAHSLRLKAIAEGVETEAQEIFLKGCGCDSMQGIYLSPPLSADRFALLLSDAAGHRLG